MNALTPVRMELANGFSAEVIPAVWNSDVAEAFQEGQCLAFAVAAAEALGENAAVLLIFREADFELAHAFAHIEISHSWSPISM